MDSSVDFESAFAVFLSFEFLDSTPGAGTKAGFSSASVGTTPAASFSRSRSSTFGVLMSADSFSAEEDGEAAASACEDTEEVFPSCSVPYFVSLNSLSASCTFCFWEPASLCTDAVPETDAASDEGTAVAEELVSNASAGILVARYSEIWGARFGAEASDVWAASCVKEPFWAASAFAACEEAPTVFLPSADPEVLASPAVDAEGSAEEPLCCADCFKASTLRSEVSLLFCSSCCMRVLSACTNRRREFSQRCCSFTRSARVRSDASASELGRADFTSSACASASAWAAFACSSHFFLPIPKNPTEFSHSSAVRRPAMTRRGSVIPYSLSCKCYS